MIQTCVICGAESEFNSALVIIDNRSKENITRSMPVCKICRKTKPLSDVYNRGPNYLVGKDA